MSPQKCKQKMRNSIRLNRGKCSPRKGRKGKKSPLTDFIEITGAKTNAAVSGRETFWWGKVFEKKYGLETAVKMSKAEVDLKNRFALHFCSCNQYQGATCCPYFHYQWGHVLEMHGDVDSAFHFYLYAAERGDPSGLYHVAKAYLNGCGVDPSKKKL